ncbi:MAG: hypothetical protein HOA66_04570, partial [Candidatus Marinimicrobia bacterium]|nr:hypothetical protein [Candidatus Neomarinimicrobiota bacterium]
YHTAEDSAVNYSLISIDDVSSLILDDGTIVITPPNSHINENISLVYTVQDITGTFVKEMNGVFFGGS